MQALPVVGTGRLGRYIPVAFSIAVLLAQMLPNPTGYVGAGGDDWYYVESARCAAVHGWCLPHDHWGARWPLIAPMAAIFALFGEGPIQAAIVPILAALAALIMLVVIIQQAFGRIEALVAGTVMAGTAAFSMALFVPNIDNVELALILAAFALGSRAVRNNDHVAAAFAGIAYACAIQARMTSVAWLPLILLASTLLPPGRRRLMVFALGGLSLPLLGEAAVYGVWAGDPLLSLHLSAAHTHIASGDLPPSLTAVGSPILNPKIIAGWHPVMGIDVHWTVNGLINLVTNLKIGWTITAAAIVLGLYRRDLSWRHPCVVLGGAAAFYLCMLIYGLAIYPLARMFLPVAAIASAITGILAVRAHGARERALMIVIVALSVGIGATASANRYDVGQSRHVAGAWAREHPGQVAIDDTTRRSLTFDATVRALPVAPQPALPRLLIQVPDQCAHAMPRNDSRGRWSLMRSVDYGRPNDPLNLCEFVRADRAVSPRH